MRQLESEQVRAMPGDNKNENLQPVRAVVPRSCHCPLAGPLPTKREAARGHRGQLACREVAGYGKQVATTWALAFGQIERAGPGALQVPEGGTASRQHACRLERRCMRSRRGSSRRAVTEHAAYLIQRDRLRRKLRHPPG